MNPIFLLKLQSKKRNTSWNSSHLDKLTKSALKLLIETRKIKINKSFFECGMQFIILEEFFRNCGWQILIENQEDSNVRCSGVRISPYKLLHSSIFDFFFLSFLVYIQCKYFPIIVQYFTIFFTRNPKICCFFLIIFSNKFSQIKLPQNFHNQMNNFITLFVQFQNLKIQRKQSNWKLYDLFKRLK
jgi:hypothetical protein